MMMKKFTLRLLLFCLAPLPVLYLLAYVVDSGLRKSRYTYYSEWNDIFGGKINADVLMVGSSRAWVQFSPKIFDSILHVNSYNIGLDGAVMGLQYDRLKIYLQHNPKPKYIIQEVGFVSTFIAYTELPGTQQFLPYLNDPVIWRLVTEHSKAFSLADRYFPMFKYNNEFVLIKEGLLSNFGRGAKEAKYKGYAGQNVNWDSSFHNFKSANPNGAAYPVDSAMIDSLQNYLGFCKANDIKVILVYPPSYIEALQYDTNYKDLLAIYDSFSKKYQIPFYNFMNDSLCYNSANFYNSQHLNKAASEIFSTKLATQLKDLIK
jgi:hypothetical protein